MPLLLALLAAFFAPPAPPTPAAAHRVSENAFPVPRVAQKSQLPDTLKFGGVIAVTQHTIVAVTGILGFDNGFAVLDRRTGKRLWGEEPETIHLRNQTISTSWRFLGSSTPDKDGHVVLVFQKTLRSSRPGPFVNTTTETEFYAQKDTGNFRGQWNWQYPTPSAPPNTDLFAAPVIGDLLPVQNTSTKQTVLWDVQTGVPLVRTSESDRAAIEKVIRANGSPLVQITQTNYLYHPQYSLYRLDTGQTFSFVADNPEETINVDAVGVTAGRALWLKQGDNGMAGHSGFASSLWCSDGNGRTVWRYPVRTYYNGEFLIPETGTLKNPAEYARLYRDVLEAVLCGRRTEEPVVVCLVRHGSDYFLDGVRVRDGKLLWSHPAPQETTFVSSPSGTTFETFFLQTQRDPKTSVPQKVTLHYLEAATGKMRKIAALPPTTSSLSVDGDDLITTDVGNIQRIYSVKKLMGAK